jgi:hypothetical protein
VAIRVVREPLYYAPFLITPFEDTGGKWKR